MPYLRIDVAGPIDSTVKRRLLAETAERFAGILETPVERIRTLVHELPADSFAVGGVPVAESGVQAPYITLDLLEGRPIAQHRELCEQIPAVVAEILSCPLERVRLKIAEVPPTGWSIGGVPASEQRRAEIESRATDDAG